MSLLDSMLLDPLRDPKDIWIALRNDGNKGSGTANDPYHGGVKLEVPFELTNLTRDTVLTTAIATTDGNHTYSDGDLVTVTGATGTGSEYYNGTFVIHSASGAEFKYDMAGNPGESASGSPIRSERNILQLDAVMQMLDVKNLEHLRIHLGPGDFLTRGNGGSANPDPQVGWRIRNGWKIIGSGIDVTVMKLVGAQNLNLGLYYAIGLKYFAAANNSEGNYSGPTVRLRGRRA